MAHLELIDSLNLVRNACETRCYLNRSLSEALTGVPITSDARGEEMLAAAKFVANPNGPIFSNPALKIIPPIALRRSLTTTSIDAPCLKAIFWTRRLRFI
ncbi:hypothetical protein RI103_19875 [Paraburkholderia sp. FT54]|uniref:hypothetical protein n=1 Tax=Paraburkholderia sp. FT54 TaxID=3074437 RepID=UPI002877CA20|nr:hypothetical protein [Paraburkholderia sp. FT54]WNC93101.1 hypothetical protein RI103_19875 [Paraburkholderia sp. FT54]